MILCSFSNPQARAGGLAPGNGGRILMKCKFYFGQTQRELFAGFPTVRCTFGLHVFLYRVTPDSSSASLIEDSLVIRLARYPSFLERLTKPSMLDGISRREKMA
jgi:hypothetical protein